MTDFGRRAGLGDMLKSVYDPNEDGVIAVGQTQADMTKAVYDPALASLAAILADHSEDHELGGDDELDVTGLPGTAGLGLLVDGVADRVFRSSVLAINNGTAGNTLKIHRNSLWNGDAEAEQDNIVKDGTTGNYTLNDTGSQLIIAAAGFSGNLLWAAAQVRYNRGGTDFLCVAQAVANNLRIMFNERTTSGGVDLTALVDVDYIQVELAYITDA